MRRVGNGSGTVAQCGGGAANEFVRRARSASQVWSDFDRDRPPGLGNPRASLDLSLATRWSWTRKVPGCPSPNQRYNGFAVRATAGETLQLGLESVCRLSASAPGSCDAARRLNLHVVICRIVVAASDGRERRRGDRRRQNVVLACRARGPWCIDFTMACSQRRGACPCDSILMAT